MCLHIHVYMHKYIGAPNFGELRKEIREREFHKWVTQPTTS